MGFTILTYFTLWATNPYKCFLEKGMAACTYDPEVRRLMPITFSVVCGLDILTDCLSTHTYPYTQTDIANSA
jgi:hypothetical protein